MDKDTDIVIEEPQVAVVVNYTIIAELYCITFFLIHYFSEQFFLSLIYAISTVVVGVNFLVLKKTKNYKRAVNVILSVGTLVISSIFGTGGVENTGYLWIFPYIAFIFFLAEELATCIFWTLVLTAISFIIVVFHWLGLLDLPYTSSLLLHLFLSFFVTVALSVIFHKARVNYEYFLSYTKRLMDTAIEPMIIISTDGKIIDANKATSSVIGKAHRSLLGENLFDHIEDRENSKK